MKKKFIGFIALMSVGFFGTAQIIHAQSGSPTAPSYISAAVTQSNQVYVSWSASTGNLPIVGYYVYRDEKLVADTPGELFYTDNAPAGIYYYTIKSYDQGGNFSPESAPSSYVTVLPDNNPPTMPTGFSATSTPTTVTLSWNPSTDNIAVVGYYVYRNGVKILTTNPITGTSYTDTGLVAGDTYNYTVDAYDAVGNVSGNAPAVSVTTIYDITPPSTPTGLTAKGISSDEIDLSWQPSTAATSIVGIAGYNIYRDGVIVGTSATSAYQDYGVSAQTSYTYQVSAYDTVGNTSQLSSPAAATSLLPDTTPPSVPQNLYATSPSTSEVDLSWSPSTDNVGVAGYYVYENTSEIGSTASTTYAALYLTTSTTYDFAVKAYDAAGNISAQSSVAATTLTTNPITPVLPATTTSAPVPPVIVLPPVIATPEPAIPPASPSTPTFTTALYFGLRNNMVTTLQLFLIGQGYLGPNYATGYFGSLTQQAVRKFQCAQNIVCSGTPTTTGWGFVGVRTRAALNSSQ